jgi:hypothetical protein
MENAFFSIKFCPKVWWDKIKTLPLHRISKQVLRFTEPTEGSLGEWLKPAVC